MHDVCKKKEKRKEKLLLALTSCHASCSCIFSLSPYVCTSFQFRLFFQQMLYLLECLLSLYQEGRVIHFIILKENSLNNDVQNS